MCQLIIELVLRLKISRQAYAGPLKLGETPT